MRNAFVAIVCAAVAGTGAWYYLSGQHAGEAVTGGAPAGQPGPGGTPGGFGAASAPLVVVAPVGYQVLVDSVEAIGTAQANESITLFAKVTDTVRRVDFEDGDFVEQGTILIQLTNQEQEASLAEAQANLDDALNQLRRLEDLTARGLAPESELDIARSRAAASEARLDTVVARLTDRLILAPFSGVLGFRQVSPGTLVTTSTPITTLDDISIIKLDFTVPETFLGAMAPGAEVLARSASYPDREFRGEVRTVGSRVDPVTRALQVRAHLPNDEGLLRPGMLLTLDVVMAERETLVVPENSVFQIQNRAYVYFVGADRVARQREIRLGARRVGYVEVLSGLSAGDLIVTEGIVKLRDGVRVRFDAASRGVEGLPDSESATSGDLSGVRG
jgi:membrane fusion protein, multidrug efflux system